MTQWFKRFRRGGPPSDALGGDLLSVAEKDALLGGDKVVLGKFIPAALPVIRGAVRTVLSRRSQPDPALEDDLTHDVIDKLLSDLNSALRLWDPAKKKTLRMFLRQWAIWRTVDLLRSSKYDRSCEQLMEDAKLYAKADAAAKADASLREPDGELWRELRRLFEERASTEQKELFQNVYTLEKKPIELAGEIGISEMNVYQRLFRLRKLLLALRDELLCEKDPAEAAALKKKTTDSRKEK